MSTRIITENEWNSIRQRFSQSLMADTEVYKLAQNIDANWPTRGPEETARKYLFDTLEELKYRPEIAGKEDRVALLHDILQETLAFDDPFGEMVEYVDSSSKKDEGAMKTLDKLEIPREFPLAFTALSKDSLDFCLAEGIETLGQFVEFAQNMAQNIVVGGDFRRLLNCLSHTDEDVIAELLPFRKKHSGLHLVECLAQLGDSLNGREKRTLCEEAGTVEKSFRFASDPALDSKKTEALLDQMEGKVKERLEFFKSDRNQIETALHDGGAALQRQFIPLSDPEKEAVAIALARLALDWNSRKKTGLFGRLFGKS